MKSGAEGAKRSSSADNSFIARCRNGAQPRQIVTPSSSVLKSQISFRLSPFSQQEEKKDRSLPSEGKGGDEMMIPSGSVTTIRT